MAAPDPDSYSLVEKIFGAVALVAVPVWGIRTWLESKFSKKMDKEDFGEFCKRFDQHCRDDRETQAKLFDKIDDLKTTIIERLK